MLDYAMPEIIWPAEYAESTLSLPVRLVSSFRRWVALGSMAADSEAALSRQTGGRA